MSIVFKSVFISLTYDYSSGSTLFHMPYIVGPTLPPNPPPTPPPNTHPTRTLPPNPPHPYVDFFRGPVVKNIRLSGLEHILQFTAANGRIYFKSYKSVYSQPSHTHSLCATPLPISTYSSFGDVSKYF